MRVKLKGLARVKKTLADGAKITYVYAWRGGPLLRHPDGRALNADDPKDHNLIVTAHGDAVRDARTKPTDTLENLIDEFRDSSEYTGLSDKSKRGYDRYLKAMGEYEYKGRKLTTLPITAIQQPAARGTFKAWRDTMSANPRTADYAWTTLARVLSVAKDKGRIAVNVCERGGRLYSADRTESVWSQEDIDAVMATASHSLQVALQMALWTGQREGDLLRAPWSAYDGKRLRIRQGKTGARVNIPLGEPLRALLDAEPRQATVILTNTRGLAWTEDGFRASWGKAVKRAGVIGLTFHDLRGTAVTNLALAGCSNAEIASITGHALRDVDAILDAHYLGGREKLADQAIAKLEGYRGGRKE